MRDAPPIFFLRHQKENAPRPVEKKKCLGGSVCAGADLLPPAGEGWQSRAAVRDGNARPLGNPSARGCPGYIQLLFSLPLAVVDESLRSGPMRASASTTARAARSEAERAEREAGQMRSCTPTTSAPSATGRQSGKSQKSIACPKARPNRSRHWYADPRTRGGPLHRSAPGAFCSYTGRGAFSFWRNQKENGGRIAQLAPQLNPPGG